MSNSSLPKIELTPHEGSGHFNREIMPLALELCRNLDQLEQDALDGKDISLMPIVKSFGDTPDQFVATAYVRQEFDDQIRNLTPEPNVLLRNRLQFRRDVVATVIDLIDLKKSI